MLVSYANVTIVFASSFTNPTMEASARTPVTWVVPGKSAWKLEEEEAVKD